MRPIDADVLTKVIISERDRIQDTYGVNDEYVRCLNKYALSMVESAHTIEVIPVGWLRNEAKLLIESEDGFDKYIGEALNTTAKYWNLKNEGTIGKWQKEQEVR